MLASQRVRSILLIAATISSFQALGQQNNVTACTPTGENREAETISIEPDFNFTWSSMWNRVPESGYCICREVHNNSSRNLYYTWSGTGVQNPALPKGHSDGRCSLDQKVASPPDSFPLYYGRSADHVDTRVWRSEREVLTGAHSNKNTEASSNEGLPRPGPVSPDASFPVLVTMELNTTVSLPTQYLLFIPLHRKERIAAHITLQSFVTKDNSGYLVSTRILNLHPKRAVFLESADGPLQLNTELPVRGRRSVEDENSFVRRNSRRGNALLGSEDQEQQTGQTVGPPAPKKKRRGAGATTASGGSGWVHWLRTHLWPAPLTPARPNFYQEVIAKSVKRTLTTPEIHQQEITISSPRGYGEDVTLNFPVWAAN